VDEKGQMVLPKDIRERGGIRPGEKMALISWEKDGSICCFTLIRADYLAQGVKDFLGPIMQGVYEGRQPEVKL
jgi:AbrB family looped-hinge helix DNA binding protein